MATMVNLEKNIARYINFSNEQAKRAFVQQVSNLQGVFSVTIKPRLRVRSNPQNRYYWGVVIPNVAAGLAEAWGEVLTPDETHIFLKQSFLARPIVNKATGLEAGHVYPSSARLSVDAFTEYLEKINKFAAESLGCVIPSSAEYSC